MPRTPSYLRQVARRDSGRPQGPRATARVAPTILKPARIYMRPWDLTPTGTLSGEEGIGTTFSPEQQTVGAIIHYAPGGRSQRRGRNELRPLQASEQQAVDQVPEATPTPTSTLSGGEEIGTTFSHEPQAEGDLPPTRGQYRLDKETQSPRRASVPRTRQPPPHPHYPRPYDTTMPDGSVYRRGERGVGMRGGPLWSPVEPHQSRPVRDEGRTSKKPQRAHVMLRPASSQEETEARRPAREDRIADDTRPKPDRTSVIAPAGEQNEAIAMAARHAAPAAKHPSEAQSRATIHIGTIDIHIAPPPSPPPPAPPVLPAASIPTRQATMASPPTSSILSRELTSFIGLRQG